MKQFKAIQTLDIVLANGLASVCAKLGIPFDALNPSRAADAICAGVEHIEQLKASQQVRVDTLRKEVDELRRNYTDKLSISRSAIDSLWERLRDVEEQLRYVVGPEDFDHFQQNYKNYKAKRNQFKTYDDGLVGLYEK